jgi:branched-chain amino acid transport system ATP-binding protein
MSDASTTGPGATDNLLEVRGLHAQYGNTKVLHGLDFDVRNGGITTILGANGAGKTTTLRAVCGMLKTQGNVLLGGERIDGKATEDIVRKGVAHVPDGRGTFLNFTVEENLRVGRLHPQRPRRGAERLRAHLWLLSPA